MDILKKIEGYKNNGKYVRLTRERGEFQDVARGYIVGYSSDYLLLQTTDDFTLNGYSIFPVNTIIGLRHNKNDKFYDQIMKLEKLKEKVCIPFDINLLTWKNLFQTLKKNKQTVTIECEEPHLDYFCIGSLNQIGEKKISTFYFSPDGIIDATPTITEYVNITKVSFGDRYANILAQYVKPNKRIKL